MLPKTSTYVKSYDGGTKWMYVLMKDDDYTIVSNSMEKELIANLCTIIFFWKTK